MDGEAPCTQPLQEHVSAPEHTPVALVIAHLLLAHKRRGSPARGGGGGGGGVLRGSESNARERAALLCPRRRTPAPCSFSTQSASPVLRTLNYCDPSASLALRFPPAARGAWCSRKVFSCALSCDPQPGISGGSGCPGPERTHKFQATCLSGKGGPVWSGPVWRGGWKGVSLPSFFELQAQRAERGTGHSEEGPQSPAPLWSPGNLLFAGMMGTPSSKNQKEEDGLDGSHTPIRFFSPSHSPYENNNSDA